MMILRLLLSISFASLFLCNQSILAHTSNAKLIDSAYNIASEQIINELSSLEISNFFLIIEKAQSKSLLENHILKKSKEKSLKVLAENINNSPELSLMIKETQILFTWNENGDSLTRNIDITIASTIKSKDLVQAIKDVSFSYQDKLSEYEANEVNTSPSDYAKVKLPPKPTSLWSDIAKPILYIAGSALSVYLLFSVRSK